MPATFYIASLPFQDALQIGGFAAHAVALRSGPLVTVQMLVSAELIVAVVIVRIWSGRPLGRACWGCGADSGRGRRGVPGTGPRLVTVTRLAIRATPQRRAWGAAATGAVLVAAAAGLRAAGRRRAVFLAVAAGLADSCSAVVTMAFSHVTGHGLAALARRPGPWYALAASGAGGTFRRPTPLIRPDP